MDSAAAKVVQSYGSRLLIRSVGRSVGRAAGVALQNGNSQLDRVRIVPAPLDGGLLVSPPDATVRRLRRQHGRRPLPLVQQPLASPGGQQHKVRPF